MSQNLFQKENQVYIAPKIYVAIFYTALIIWTVLSIALLNMKGLVNSVQFFIIGFIFIFTWYFSIGIFYQIEIKEGGIIELKSIRRILKVDAKNLVLIEGPHFPLGFLRLKTEQDKIYLFCTLKNKVLQKILMEIGRLNPEIKFRNV